MGKKESMIQDLIGINTSNTLVSNDPRMSWTAGELAGEQRCRDVWGQNRQHIKRGPPAQWHDKHRFGAILQNPAEQGAAITPLHSPLLKARMEFYAQPWGTCFEHALEG